ncbi:MAG: hypothetical protein WBL28_04645 [Methylotenera sp.]
MYKIIGLCLLLGGLVFGWAVDAQLSAPEKINKAFPPSAEVRISLENLGSLIPTDDESLKLFKSNYESRLTLKALTCSQGYSVSRFDSIEKVKKLAIDRDCLKDQDEQLQQLIGLKLVGFRLAQAPLKPLVKLGSPSTIPNPDGVEIYMGKSASKSGVAVLRGSRNEFVSVEIPNGKKITSLPTMPEASQANFLLSPNGRILAIPVNNRDLRFLDTETGQELWHAKDINNIDAWLPEVQAALVRNNKNGKNEISLVDFKEGKIKPYSSPNNNPLPWALHVSESPSRVLIGIHTDFTLFENVRSTSGVDSSIIKTFTIKSRKGINQPTPILMLDGKAIAFATTDMNFMLINLETGEEKVFETREFLLSRSFAKLNEETLLVDSFNNFGQRQVKTWVLNVKDSTLSPVETTEANTGELYALDGRTGFMRREYQKMWVGDELRIGKPESLETIIAGRKLEMQLAALENEERMAKAREEAMKAAQEINRVQQQMGMKGAPTTGITQLREKILLDQLKQIERNRYAVSAPTASAVDAVPPTVPSTTYNYSAAANEARKQAILNATNRMLGNIPSNAKVEAVGVYETKDRSPSGISVIVKKSDTPLVLMLSGYEPVRWNLIKEPGANLIAVIATGYNLPEVTGAGATKTVIKRGNYAYQQGSPEYVALNNDAIMWTGKPISKFQGIYGGTVFVVGN